MSRLRKRSETPKRCLKSKVRLEDLVVAFVAIENRDDESVARMAVEEIKKYLDIVKSSRLLVYPYAHLTLTLRLHQLQLISSSLLKTSPRNR